MALAFRHQTKCHPNKNHYNRFNVNFQIVLCNYLENSSSKFKQIKEFANSRKLIDFFGYRYSLEYRLNFCVPSFTSSICNFFRIQQTEKISQPWEQSNTKATSNDWLAFGATLFLLFAIIGGYFCLRFATKWTPLASFVSLAAASAIPSKYRCRRYLRFTHWCRRTHRSTTARPKILST